MIYVSSLKQGEQSDSFGRYLICRVTIGGLDELDRMAPFNIISDYELKFRGWRQIEYFRIDVYIFEMYLLFQTLAGTNYDPVSIPHETFLRIDEFGPGNVG